MKPTLIFLLASLIGSGLLSPSFAQEILIQNAHIVTGDFSGQADPLDLLIKDGQITGIGSGLEAGPEAQVIDAQGKPVTSGFFNADTQLGLREVSAVAPTVDSYTENEAITASLKVSDAVNPHSTLFAFNRSLGVTHTLVQPSNGVGLFAGTAAIIKLVDDAIVVEQAAMNVSLGEQGSALAGGSRAAAMGLLREAIEDARDYAKNRADFNRGSRRSYRMSRHDLEALVPVVQRRLPLLVRVERASEILKVLEFAQQQKVTLILSGVSEGWRVAAQIAKAEVPVILDPINNLPVSYETLGARLDNAALLNEAGVTLMFTGMGWQNTHNAHLVRQSAGNAVANGLPYAVAIKALTENPAKILGIPDFGSIKIGAKTSLVVWSGDPLEVTSQPEAVVVDGQLQSLVSRSTRLRDRYYDSIRAQQAADLAEQ